MPAHTIATATMSAVIASSSSMPVISTSTSATSTPARGERVGAQVRRVALERGRVGEPRLPVQVGRDDEVRDHREADHRDAEAEVLDAGVIDEPADGLVDDDPGADEDQHPLDPGRDVLDLLVAVRVRLVGRLVGLAHREVGDQRRHQVDPRVDRLGDDRDRPGYRARDELERDQRCSSTRSRSRPHASCAAASGSAPRPGRASRAVSEPVEERARGAAAVADRVLLRDAELGHRPAVVACRPARTRGRSRSRRRRAAPSPARPRSAR